MPIDYIAPGTPGYLGAYKGVAVYKMKKKDFFALDTAVRMNKDYMWIIAEDGYAIYGDIMYGHVNWNTMHLTELKSSQRISYKVFYATDLKGVETSSRQRGVVEASPQSRQQVISSRVSEEKLQKDALAKLQGLFKEGVAKYDEYVGMGSQRLGEHQEASRRLVATFERKTGTA